MAKGKVKSKQKVSFALVGLDSDNLPAPITEAKVTLSDSALATLQVNPDGLGGFVVPVGPLGAVQVQASALNADGASVSGVGEVEIGAAAAVLIDVQLGTPEPQ